MSQTLINKLTGSISRNYSEGILLSGGIDSSSLLALSVQNLGRYPLAFTVSLGTQGEDLVGAEKVTSYLRSKWTPIVVSEEEAIEEGLPNIVKINKSFDLGILNDLPYFFGMSRLIKEGLDNVMTGNGGDWLFLGYSFLWDQKERANQYVYEAISHIDWGSVKIGDELGIKVTQPYLDHEFVKYALNIPFRDKVQILEGMEKSGDKAVEICGDQSKKDIWSKIALRKAMEKYLPQETAWRQKSDLEFGSGMTFLSEKLKEKVSEDEFKKIVKRTGINFWGG